MHSNLEHKLRHNDLLVDYFSQNIVARLLMKTTHMTPVLHQFHLHPVAETIMHNKVVAALPPVPVHLKDMCPLYNPSIITSLRHMEARGCTLF